MWTYLKFDQHSEYLDGEKEKLPPDGTAYLAFDIGRWCVVIGYTERGGYSSILNPNVSDDCLIAAFAPLSELSNPDESVIRANFPAFESGDDQPKPKTILLR